MWLFGKKDNDNKKEQKSSARTNSNDSKKEQESNERTISEQNIEETCLKIAKIISQNDESVLTDLKEGCENPQTYIAKYHAYLSENYMLDADEMEDFVRDKWWLMTDILERKEYVCVRDWKDELEDFLYFLSQTKRAISENIKPDELDLPFSEEDDISIWSALIDKELTNRSLTVGNIDMGSDEYTLFLCAVDELEALESYAGSIGHRIMPAKEA